MSILLTDIKTPVHERRTGVPRRMVYNRKPDLSILDRRVKATRRRYVYAKRNFLAARAAFHVTLLAIVASWLWVIYEVTK